MSYIPLVSQPQSYTSKRRCSPILMLVLRSSLSLVSVSALLLLISHVLCS